jgi:hypothetical protein
MTQTLANQHNNKNSAAAISNWYAYTKLSNVAEPMTANDWLCSVNKDLVTNGCSDAESQIRRSRNFTPRVSKLST